MKRLLYFFLLPVLANSSVQADLNSTCQDYANNAVKQYRDAIQKGLQIGDGRWHDNYSLHYNWCMDLKADPKALETETNARAKILNPTVNRLTVIQPYRPETIARTPAGVRISELHTIKLKPSRSILNYQYQRDSDGSNQSANAIIYQQEGATNRPLIILIPGWGGQGNVSPSEPSATAQKLASEGYIIASIGFKSTGNWSSDLPESTKGFISTYYSKYPHSNPIVFLWGNSYGGLQSKIVTRYLRDQGLPVRGFLATDAGYTLDWSEPKYADTTQYSIAMLQNLGDTTIKPKSCEWNNCGAVERAIFHRQRGDTKVYSKCFAGGNHGSQPSGWNEWSSSALKQMIHTDWKYPKWQEVKLDTTVSNECY